MLAAVFALRFFGVAQALVAVFGAGRACWAFAVAARLASSTCQASVGDLKSERAIFDKVLRREQATSGRRGEDVRGVDPAALGGRLALVVDKANLPRGGGGRVRLAKGHIHGLTMAMRDGCVAAMSWREERFDRKAARRVVETRKGGIGLSSQGSR
ncbi:hypothetical protein PWT90_07576 [Aphanocladium album]|nr:hypothetical protein PWT90_07576 [Aphanocladium album]